MKNIIVFDLDGTLADDGHRQHFLQQNPKNWEAYFAACPHDKPVDAVIELARAYCGWLTMVNTTINHLSFSTIELWSARSDIVATQTMQWLHDHRIYNIFDRIRLRPDEDRRDGETVKLQWLEQERALGNQVVLAVEDRTRVVNMWRANGVPCFQVAEGNF